MNSPVFGSRLLMGSVLLLFSAGVGAKPFPMASGGNARYMGEYCFYLDDGTLFPPQSSRIGFLQYGPDHVLVSGNVTFVGEAYGTGVATEDKWIINMTGMEGTFGVSGNYAVRVNHLRMGIDRGTAEGEYVITGYLLPDIDGLSENHVVIGGRVFRISCGDLGVGGEEWEP